MRRRSESGIRRRPGPEALFRLKKSRGVAPPTPGRAAPDDAVTAFALAGTCLRCRLSNATSISPFTGSVDFSFYRTGVRWA